MDPLKLDDWVIGTISFYGLVDFFAIDKINGKERKKWDVPLWTSGLSPKANIRDLMNVYAHRDRLKLTQKINVYKINNNVNKVKYKYENQKWSLQNFTAKRSHV